jgi:hypothetical protein
VSEQELVIFNLELNVEKAFSNVRKIEMLAYRALGLLGRINKLLGLPEDSPFNQMVIRVQRLTMIIRTLHTSAVMLQAASGPIGIAMAGVGIATSAVVMAESAGMMLEGY